jgi:myosin III
MGYDSESDPWDEPLRRRPNTASHQIRISIQKTNEDYIPVVEKQSNQSLIHLPYCRDPTQTIKKLPPEPTDHGSYGRQNAQSPWKDSESGRPGIYKKKHSPSPRNSSPAVEIVRKDDDWQFPKLNPVKSDMNKNIYRGSMPDDMNNPILELKHLARAKSSDFPDEDDPPFNFQAMLRKTPRNRASMKRDGESPTSTVKDSDFNFNKPPTPLSGIVEDKKTPKGKAPPRPRSCQDFKRKDSKELFKMAIKRTDSSQNFISCISNGNIGERVQLAPGIAVEGYVIDI